MTLADKDPEETITVTFDFSAEADTLSAAVITASVVEGLNDASPETIIDGARTISGPLVIQRISGGQHGTTYALRCVANDIDGEVLVLTAALKVQTAQPQ